MTIGRLHWARLAGIVLLALVLAVFGGLAFERRLGAEKPVVGVEWVQSSFGPVAIAVQQESPAWTSGIRPGDLLISANGMRIRSALDAAALLWSLDSGEHLLLEFERGEETRTVELEGTRLPRSEPYGYLVVVGLAFFLSGAFIALRWPSVRGGTLYSLLAVCLFTHLVFSHTGRADAVDWAVYWMDFTAGALAPALLLHFTLALSRRAIPARRLTLALAYAPAVGLLLAGYWLSPAGLGGAYRFQSPVAAEETMERWGTFYLAVAVLLAVFVLVRSYGRSSSTLQRSQLRWLIWGLAVGLVPFVALYAVPFSLGRADLPSWAELMSVLPMLIVPAAFTVALARYRLHDLSLLLRRGLAEVTALFFTAAVYVVVRQAASELLNVSHSAARYTGFLVALVLYIQVRVWVRVWVDRAFYRRRYSYRATLLDWARELAAEMDLASLLERLRERVRDTLDVKEAQVLIRAVASGFEVPGNGLSRLQVDLDGGLLARLERETAVSLEPASVREIPWARWLFPMKVKGRLTAVLATADRDAPEEPLSTEDRALLSTLSAHAATAIEAARLVHEVRQRAEEIEQLHSRQEKILESSAVGLLLTDDEGKILAWNRALEEIYELRREEAIGRRLGDVFPLHMIRRIEHEAASAPPGEQARIYRLTLVNRAGKRIVVNLGITSATQVREGMGARVITFDDVSERVKLEEQVLRQERLASLGMLAAGVAHEMNTPLTGISSYTQLLLEELPEGDPRRNTLGKIEDQTRRASNIVNSLLNLARPEQTVFQPMSLNETIREVLQLFEAQVRGRDIRMKTSLDASVPRVRGHRGKIQQVLLNLLINARDAVEHGGEISISTRHRGERIVVEVVDDGVGIAEEDLPQVFDPFFTTKGRGKGTGLGLSISYGIVQEHGGEMSAESTPGEFTRFRVELPMASSVEALA